MPYVLPSSSIDKPQLAPLPIPHAQHDRADEHEQGTEETKTYTLAPRPATGTTTSAPTPDSEWSSPNTNSSTAINTPADGPNADPEPETDQDASARPAPQPLAVPASMPSMSSQHVGATALSPSPPSPSSVALLSGTFAGVGLSDSHVPTLQTRYEASPVMLPQARVQDGDGDGDGAGEADVMPRLPPSIVTAQAPASVEQEQEQEPGPSRRPSEPASLPDLAASSSSTSIDTLDEHSPIEPAASAGPADVVVRASGDAELEEDPKVRALIKYKEGLYAYTRGLYLEAKSSTSREKRRASVSAGGASGAFGVKQSGMERLAAKKALARRLNA